jgi:ParB family transcriptional regulator, chromosome partitioning protein
MTTKRDKPYGRKLRGLDAFIGDIPSQPPTSNAIAITAIALPPQQPRRYFDPDKMAQLVNSVREHGILEPLLVRPLANGQYELVAGERRYRAAKQLGLTEVPVVIRELADHEALQLALIENLQREDLNPIEETEAILQLLGLSLNASMPEVSSLLYRMQNAAAGKVTDNVISNFEKEAVTQVFEALGGMGWESFTANRLPLMRLPEDVLQALRQGKLAYTKAQAIARLKDESQRQQVLEMAIAQDLSLAQIREHIRNQTPAEPAPQTLKTRLTATVHRMQKASFWDDPKTQKRIEKLLTQMEALLAEQE